jgi:hypothetical protein
LRSPMIEVGLIAMLVIANLYVLMQRYWVISRTGSQDRKCAPFCL